MMIFVVGNINLLLDCVGLNILIFYLEFLMKIDLEKNNKGFKIKFFEIN